MFLSSSVLLATNSAVGEGRRHVVVLGVGELGTNLPAMVHLRPPVVVSGLQSFRILNSQLWQSLVLPTLISRAIQLLLALHCLGFNFPL